MSAQELSALVGTVLSLGLAYIPGLKDLYDKLAAPQKALTMGVLLLVTAAGALVYACYPAEAGLWRCVSANWKLYLEAFFAALIANQSAYMLFVRRVKK